MKWEPFFFLPQFASLSTAGWSKERCTFKSILLIVFVQTYVMANYLKIVIEFIEVDDKKKLIVMFMLIQKSKIIAFIKYVWIQSGFWKF